MSKNYRLVSQSFGRTYEYHRLIMMVWSFYAFADHNIPTLVFTDRPEYFKAYFQGLPVSYSVLDAAKIKKMRGEIDFLHRMKIALIEEAMAGTTDNLLYTDSDTFFIADPTALMEQVSAEQSFMHTHEYVFEEHRNAALPAGQYINAFIECLDVQQPKIPGTDMRITTQMSSWNAGVLMLHNSNKHYLDKVYQLTDLFFPASGSHAAEQYAFSVVLQSMGKLAAAETVIFHYWYNIKKKIMDLYTEQHLAALEHQSWEHKKAFILKAVHDLPALFENHILSLKDKAIQYFNDKNYAQGLHYAVKAFSEGAWRDKVFVKDVLYHTKKKMLGT